MPTGIPSQIVPIAFEKGQDSRTNPKLVVPGKWLSLINYSLSQDNTPRRRDGSSQLVQATANGLATHGSELLAISGSAVSSYSPGQSALARVLGETAGVNISRAPIQSENAKQDSQDMASGTSGSGTYTCYVWRELDQFATPTGINCTLVDEATGTKLFSNTVLRADAAAFCPRVVYSLGAFLIFYISGTHLFCRVLRPSTSTTPGVETAVLTAATLADINFDVCAFGSTSISTAMVVYGWTDGATSVQALIVSSVAVTPSVFLGPTNLVAQATIAVANIRGLCCAAFGATSNAAAFVLHTGGVSGVVVNGSLAVSTAVALLDAFAPAGSASHITAVLTTIGSTCMQVLSDQQGAAMTGTAALCPIRSSAWNSTLGNVSPAVTLINSNSFDGTPGNAIGPSGPWICGKAFTGSASGDTGGNPTVYLPVCILEFAGFVTRSPNNNEQNSFFLLDCTSSLFTTKVKSGAVVAKALYGGMGVPSINGAAPTVSSPCSCPVIGSGNAVLVNHQTLFQVSNGLNVSAVGLSRLTMTPQSTQGPIRSEMGPVLFLQGGAVSAYDGTQILEHGFNLFPEGVGGTIAATGGGSNSGMTDGTHQFVAVYEWFNAQGLREQSALSLPVSLTRSGANPPVNDNKVTLKIPTLQLTQKTGVNIVIYATQANGTSFTRMALSATHPIPNNTAATNVSIQITDADSVFAGNEALYSQPNQGDSTLPNDAPPPCKALCASQNRLFLLSADNDLEYRYSQEMLNGFGLQFAGLYGDTTLGGLVPSDSGGTVAVSALDEKTIILCARKLYVIYGSFPDSAGNNSTLSEPQEIPSPVGCSDVHSVLLMPQGLMFKAQSGWHLLGRDLSVQYIGEGVDGPYDALSVVSATLMRDRQECRFEMQYPNSADGVCLVFSYLIGQWSVFQRIHSTLLHPRGAADALWYPALNRYVFACFPNGNLSAMSILQDVPLFDGSGLWTGQSPDDFVGTGFEAGVNTTAETSWLRLSALEGFQRVRRVYLTSTLVDPGNVPTATSLGLAVTFDDDPNSPFAYSATFDPTTLPAQANIDLRHKLTHQKCKSVRFTLTETVTPGGSVNPLSGIQAMALEIGIKKGVRKLPAGQTF